MMHVCGLWLNTSNNGKTYMSGSLGGMKVLVFKNNNKASSKQPDYRLCFGEKEYKHSNKDNDSLSREHVTAKQDSEKETF